LFFGGDYWRNCHTNPPRITNIGGSNDIKDDLKRVLQWVNDHDNEFVVWQFSDIDFIMELKASMVDEVSFSYLFFSFIDI
jgi:hypothetical protein